MRWSVILSVGILLALFVPSVSAVNTWGCCVPPVGLCFQGSGAFPSEEAFRSACTAVRGQVKGADVLSTCDSYMRGPLETAVCTVGCCCAGPAVAESPTINNDETQLSATKAECTVQGADYNFEIKTPGLTCVSICGGTQDPTPSPAVNFTITGFIKNATSDAPLPGVAVYIPIPSGQISTTTDAQGAYILREVPPITARVFATFPACRPGQSAPIVFNADKSGVNVSLDCTMQMCPHAAPTITAPTLIKGTSRITFTASVADSCHDFVQYEPMRCNAQFDAASCTALPPSTSPAIFDSGNGLKNKTTYCYIVRARFSGGVVKESEKVTSACVTTGDSECMSRSGNEPASWCGKTGAPAKSAILTCDDSNVIKATPCEGTTVCSSTSGTPTCIVPPPCDQCNGLLGFFASLGLSITPDEREISCEQAQEEGLCFMDRAVKGRPVIIDAYASCTAVDSCSQYHNRDSCEVNICGVEANNQTACQWSQLNEELGLGICTSKKSPACERCEDALGYCNKDLCEKISDTCYFDQEKNGLAKTRGCLSKPAMACRYYDTKADCVAGGTGATYNIQFTQGVRSGGDNKRTASSADKLGIGACTWLDTQMRCIKDADKNLSIKNEDDCIENNYIRTDAECSVDSTPPVTTFFFASPAIYPRNALQTIPFTVTDDRTPSQLIQTFVCFQASGATPCYPNMTLAALPALPEPGSYSLRYYSMDAVQNSEEIKNATITIQDSDVAALQSVVLEENQ